MARNLRQIMLKKLLTLLFYAALAYFLWSVNKHLHEQPGHVNSIRSSDYYARVVAERYHVVEHFIIWQRLNL
jgi:hypothetical protein